MPLYFFKATDGTSTLQDDRGSQFSDDEMAMQEVLQTVRTAFGRDPVTLTVTDDAGRVVRHQVMSDLTSKPQQTSSQEIAAANARSKNTPGTLSLKGLAVLALLALLAGAAAWYWQWKPTSAISTTR